MFVYVHVTELASVYMHVLPFLLLSLISFSPLPEINLKEQLVEQLEKAQKNLLVMRQQYEEKMTLLQNQIHSIEAERDKVLKDICK